MIRKVYERWVVRNGDVVVIQFRCGQEATGHIEGSHAALAWKSGLSENGRGYDLVRQLPDAESLMRERLAREGTNVRN